ncbi:hypothetical protein HS088_TW10G00287 [Tripterygium wilfordii]|uniref:P-loop containing nucleoside triphosphate hydrolases superfamily protein n=1 Tax=Tripterygium wilfordii TaxID=458696 RepID=A0A7J7D4P4_TRIWF|nr:uncharacterized protein LOC120006866 [Tripterygium wilfordii]KAF5741291.1 hypothetical protein HS088_TW10G00287 [Tripterygium wilfordii]
MGGATISSFNSTPEEEVSSVDQDFSNSSSVKPAYLRKVEDGGLNVKYNEADRPISPSSLDLEVNQRRRQNTYVEVWQSYDRLRTRSKNLEEAKCKISSYAPGVWIEELGGMKLSDYDVPKTTSLLLIGPKGSGKSSLINRISKVFDDDESSSERAQVSYNSLLGDGTYFIQEYMIPRGSTSFCLYDTRSLSDDLSENIEMIKCWMTKGVRHGELVIRESDGSDLRKKLKRKARGNGCQSCKVRIINFVIFVVDGLAFLKSMDTDGNTKTQFMQMIAETFNCPYLSFKDDKPVVVVTHGDLLSLTDRARIRVHLGKLLGISPAKQIFDIPEICEPATDLAIVDLLRYSLEHAERHLPCKKWIGDKVRSASLSGVSRSGFICLYIILGIAIIIACMRHAHGHHPAKPPPHVHFHHPAKPIPLVDWPKIDWHKIRHLWLDES